MSITCEWVDIFVFNTTEYLFQNFCLKLEFSYDRFHPLDHISYLLIVSITLFNASNMKLPFSPYNNHVILLNALVASPTPYNKFQIRLYLEQF